MESITKHRIVSVDPDSPAYDAGIEAGDFLLSVNGEPIIDIIDYEQLTANEEITVLFSKEGGINL